MFYKLILRQVKRNYRESGQYFFSMVIAIVASYSLLALEKQDVIHFLKSMESDAIQKLLNLLPIVYGVALFFLFFLVHLAAKYHIDLRRKELGTYLSLGMKRAELFNLLLGESLAWTFFSLLVGIPVAIFLNEGLSLATARLLDLDLFSHQFSFSLPAVLGTVVGFVLIQLISILIISWPISRTEPAALLAYQAEAKHKNFSRRRGTIFFALGTLLLATAYYLGVTEGDMTYLPLRFLLILFLGITGTFLFYAGLGAFLDLKLRVRAKQATGLEQFTRRQLQENVIHQPASLALACLLLMGAMALISFGLSSAYTRTSMVEAPDFSVFGEEAQVEAFLVDDEVKNLIKGSTAISISYAPREIWEGSDLSEVEQIMGEDRKLAQDLFLIKLSEYNATLKLLGKEEIQLKENELAFFTALPEMNTMSALRKGLKTELNFKYNSKEYRGYPQLQEINVVADREITIYLGLIVPDPLYEELTNDFEPYAWNLQVSEVAKKEKGYLQTLLFLGEKAKQAGLQSESAIAGFARQLFYTVSASYLTIYLGLIFLLIANSVISLKFLGQLRDSLPRYRSLFVLGAKREDVQGSLSEQVLRYFAWVCGVALLSSVFAIYFMLVYMRGINLQSPMGKQQLNYSGIALLLFVLLEFAYILYVRNSSFRQLEQLERSVES